MPQSDQVRIITLEEYADLMTATGFNDGSILSPYQSPALLRARVKSGMTVVAAGIRHDGVDSIAAFVHEDGEWMAHEVLVDDSVAAELTRGVAEHTETPARMSVRVDSTVGEPATVGVTYATLVIPTDHPDEALWREFSPACRRALRRFDESGHTIEFLDGDRDPGAIMEALAPFDQRPEVCGGLAQEAFRTYGMELLRCGAAVLIVLRWQQQVTSVAITILGRGIANLRYTTTTRFAFPESTGTRAGNGLVAAAIRLLRDHRIQWLDLSGITLEATSGHPNSIDRFKLGFSRQIWLFRQIRYPGVDP